MNALSVANVRVISTQNFTGLTIYSDLSSQDFARAIELIRGRGLLPELLDEGWVHVFCREHFDRHIAALPDAMVYGSSHTAADLFPLQPR